MRGEMGSEELSPVEYVWVQRRRNGYFAMPHPRSRVVCSGGKENGFQCGPEGSYRFRQST